MISFNAPNEHSTDGNEPGAAIYAVSETGFDDDENSTAIGFSTATSTSALALAQERMRILANGNVGIGITTPGRMLDLAADNDGINTEAELPGNILRFTDTD